MDPLTTDYSHIGWIKVAAGDGEFQKSLGCGMCVEIKGQGILAELAGRERIPKTPIIGPVYAVVIDRCGNCKQGIKLTFKYSSSMQKYAPHRELTCSMTYITSARVYTLFCVIL